MEAELRTRCVVAGLHAGRFLKGWLRPDNLPQSLEMHLTPQHFVASSGPSPVAACLSSTEELN